MDTAIAKPSAPNAPLNGGTNSIPALASGSTPTKSSGGATIVAGPGQTVLNVRDIQALETRSLDAETMAQYGVRSSERLGGSIAIPFIRDGIAVNHKYRRVVKAEGKLNFEQDAGGAQCFWNIDVLSDETLKNEPLIITEGEFDAFSAIQCGFPRTMSVPNGAPNEEQGAKEGRKYAFVDEAMPFLRDVREIILCVDGDGPGANLLNDLALRLGKARCKFVKYPKGCKDLNDALNAYGPKGVMETIRRASFMKVDGVYLMSELPPVEYKKPHDVGIPGLERHFRIRKGDFGVITGVPSHGKTTLVNAIGCQMANVFGWKSAWASFEQSPVADHRRSLRTFFNERLEKDQTPEQKARADDWIDRHFTFIVPDEDDDVTLEWVLERCAAAVLQHGVQMIVIDPWNEMDHTRPSDMSLTEYVGFAIKQFKKFASKYNVFLMVVAHPAKMRKADDGKYPIPSLYDISDSAHWYNKADVGIVVHRPDERTLARVAKSRYHSEIGEPGDVYLHFCMETGRYSLVEKEMRA